MYMYVFDIDYPLVSSPLTGLGRSDLDRFRLREVVESVKDVTKLDPHKLFVELFKATLDFRLKEDVFSRVSNA